MRVGAPLSAVARALSQPGSGVARRTSVPSAPSFHNSASLIWGRPTGNPVLSSSSTWSGKRCESSMMVDGAVDLSRRGAVASTATRARAVNESGAAPRTILRRRAWVIEG